MATKTNVYVKIEENSYVIDNDNGHIPAVHYVENNFEALFVVPRASTFDFANKLIEWVVEEFVWNRIDSKWISVSTSKFNKFDNGTSKLLVDVHSMVNAQGQVVSENGVMSEIDYYIASLGKQAIFPALQAAIKIKLD